MLTVNKKILKITTLKNSAKIMKSMFSIVVQSIFKKNFIYLKIY
jgi:hypothetical protein